MRVFKNKVIFKKVDSKADGVRRVVRYSRKNRQTTKPRLKFSGSNCGKVQSKIEHLILNDTARCSKLLRLVYHYTLVSTAPDKGFLNSPLKF